LIYVRSGADTEAFTKTLAAEVRKAMPEFEKSAEGLFSYETDDEEIRYTAAITGKSEIWGQVGSVAYGFSAAIKSTSSAFGARKKHPAVRRDVFHTTRPEIFMKRY
jgi:hypothetical protein